MATLKAQLTEAMKDAMRAKDKPRLGVIRMMLSECKRIEVDERIELDDARVLAILDKQSKQRRDAAQQYKEAGREDLEAQENFEIAVIQEFLPQALSDTEILNLIQQAIDSTNAQGMADMGKVMGIIKPQMQGRADMGIVSKRVKELLV